MAFGLRTRVHGTDVPRSASPPLTDSSEIVIDLRSHTGLGPFTAIGPAAEVLALVAFAVVALAAVSFHWARGGELSDAWADWLTVSAAIDGLNPYGDVLDLASRYELPINVAAQSEAELGPGPWVHPRAPSALTLIAPASLLSAEGYRLTILWASVIALTWMVIHQLPRLTGIPRGALLLGAPLLIPSYPVFATLEFGTQSALIAGLVMFAWIRSNEGRQRVAGIAIGIAAALKVWPLLLLVPFWMTRRRAAVFAALVTTSSVTVVGMVAFGIGPSRVVDAFGAATERWLLFSPNGSLIGWAVRAGIPFGIALVLGIGAALALTGLVARRDPISAIPAGIVLAVLLSPLSWAHYDVALVGVAVWLFTRSRWQRNVGIAWLMATVSAVGLRFFSSSAFTVVGLYTLAGRLAMAVVIVAPALMWSRDREKPLESGLAVTL